MAESVEPLEMDLEIPANGDYSKTWALTDKATGDSLLAGTESLKMQVREAQNETSTIKIDLENQSDDTVSGFVFAVDVSTTGQFQVTIRRDDLAGLIPAGAKKVTLFYDFGVLYSDDFFIVYTKGKVILDIGVTDAG